MRERSGDGMRLFVCSIIAAAAMLCFGSCLSFAREAENIQTGTDAAAYTGDPQKRTGGRDRSV